MTESGLGHAKTRGTRARSPGIGTLPDAARRRQRLQRSIRSKSNGRRRQPPRVGSQTERRCLGTGRHRILADSCVGGHSGQRLSHACDSQQSERQCEGCWRTSWRSREGTINLECPRADWQLERRADDGLKVAGAKLVLHDAVFPCDALRHWMPLLLISELPSANLRASEAGRRPVRGLSLCQS